MLFGFLVLWQLLKVLEEFPRKETERGGGGGRAPCPTTKRDTNVAWDTPRVETGNRRGTREDAARDKGRVPSQNVLGNTLATCSGWDTTRVPPGSDLGTQTT